MINIDYPEIVFEDNHVLVAVKSAGVLSQSDGTDAPDMLTQLKAYLKDKYNKPGDAYFGLLHRLDRNVSGLMVFAKTSKCASRLSEQIRSGRVRKGYCAIVSGHIEKRSDTLISYLIKDENMNMVRVLDNEVLNSKFAKLSYEVKGYATRDDKEYSLLQIELVTGRSHQIRAQFAHIGYPLIGDTKYGVKNSRTSICLQSNYLGFYHPINGEFLEYTIDRPNVKPWTYFESN